MTDPIADDSWVHPSGCVAVPEIWLLERHLLKIASEAANEHSSGGTRDLSKRYSTGIESLVNDLKKFLSPVSLDRTKFNPAILCLLFVEGP